MKRLEKKQAIERQVEFGQFPNCAVCFVYGDCIKGAIVYITEKKKRKMTIRKQQPETVDLETCLLDLE